MSEQRESDLTKELAEGLIPPKSTDEDDDIEVSPELEKWVEETKGVERIISVAITTSEPHTAEWIADQAQVSEQTARDHLKTFSDLGIVAMITASGVTRYHADEAFIHYREVSRYVDQHSKEELFEKVEAVQTSLKDIKEEYDVRTPDELRSKAAEDDTDIEAIRQYKKTAAEWETLRDQLGVLEDALRQYDRFDGLARAKV